MRGFPEETAKAAPAEALVNSLAMALPFEPAEKLRDRARRIITIVTGLEYEEADRDLSIAIGSPTMEVFRKGGGYQTPGEVLGKKAPDDCIQIVNFQIRAKHGKGLVLKGCCEIPPVGIMEDIGTLHSATGHAAMPR